MKHITVAFFYVLFPWLALFWALPPVLGLPPLLTFPYYLGLLAAPGYLYVVFLDSGKPLSQKTRWWIKFSLVLAALSSAYGVALGLFLPFISVASFISFLFCLKLFFGFRKSLRTTDREHRMGAGDEKSNREALLGLGISSGFPFIMTWVAFRYQLYWILPKLWLIQFVYLISAILIAEYKGKRRAFIFASILGSSTIVFGNGLLFLLKLWVPWK